MKHAQNLGCTQLPSELALEPELKEACGGHWDGWRGLGRALGSPARPSGGARAHCRALEVSRGSQRALRGPHEAWRPHWKASRESLRTLGSLGGFWGQLECTGWPWETRGCRPTGLRREDPAAKTGGNKDTDQGRLVLPSSR